MMNILRAASLFALFAFCAVPLQAAEKKATELTWYGHSAFKIVTPAGKVLLVDPWIANPSNPNAERDLAALENVDLVLITHGHADHVGQASEIFGKTEARLVAPLGLSRALVAAGIVPQERTGMELSGNFGGEIVLLDGEVKVAFIPALHDSDLALPESGERAGQSIPAGNPAGFLISIQGGPAIYHTGDTDLFGDMALVRQFRPVDLMLVCIGDRFTMGPARAARAVGLVEPKRVVPMHYGTFPLLTGTPEAFEKELKASGSKADLTTMKPGGVITLK